MVRVVYRGPADRFNGQDNARGQVFDLAPEQIDALQRQGHRLELYEVEAPMSQNPTPPPPSPEAPNTPPQGTPPDQLPDQAVPNPPVEQPEQPAPNPQPQENPPPPQ